MCRRKLREDRVRIIDKRDAVTLCCATCVSCLSSLLFSVSAIDQNIIATAGLLTDAQEADMLLLRDDRAVCVDDALCMYRFLEQSGTQGSF